MGSLFGVILIILTNYKYGWFDFKSLISILAVTIIIYIYSLLADVDCKSSTIVWTFIPLGLAAAIFGVGMHMYVYILCGIGLISITFFAAEFMPHRGFTHSILFGIIMSAPLYVLHHEFAVLAFVCFYSHLAADGLFIKLT